MARKPRIEYEGAFYHVITRGNQRQKIFKTTTDYEKYLELVVFYKQRYHFLLYAYVLMNNHVHMLIETREIPLSKILQGINQSYTIYFNRKYRTVGHLFQGRYKAILCDRDEYLMTLVKYIHLNPVRANICAKADDYSWSSHYYYTRKDQKKDLIDTDLVLRMFSEKKLSARKLYASFVDNGLSVDKEDIYSLADQRVLGDERFVDTVMDKVDAEIGMERRSREFTLSKIAAGVKRVFDVPPIEMRRKGRDLRLLTARRAFSLVAKEYGYRGREISRFLGRDPSVVTRYLRERLQLEADIEMVIKALKDEE